MERCISATSQAQAQAQGGRGITFDEVICLRSSSEENSDMSGAWKETGRIGTTSGDCETGGGNEWSDFWAETLPTPPGPPPGPVSTPPRATRKV